MKIWGRRQSGCRRVQACKSAIGTRGKTVSPLFIGHCMKRNMLLGETTNEPTLDSLLSPSQHNRKCSKLQQVFLR
ncbi:hypothetical protein MtrunA17_Chr3g0116921 [Medicago truncatula]|uniref:Uncharacterized protein n=1 Tax=Medicago truncatula TaxID=3880 RepID=A0A396ISQ0_MEDTR|nr:hypothetical protein MtrunA17_Chr3g0116921 [Medicago truncatula]